jgi:uncharacterized membrane protein HdeD (DUF308 family)
VGFGLWNDFMATVVVEIALLIGGLILYLRSTTATGAMGKYGMIVFVALMICLYLLVVNMPFDPNATVTVASVSSLAVFTLFTAIAFWLDRYRV